MSEKKGNSMLRLATSFAAAGLIIPLILTGVAVVLGHFRAASGQSRFEDALLWVWPSSIMIMATEGKTLAVQIETLLMSALVNGALYFVCGLIIASVWRMVRRRKSGETTG